jgi:hypothetical protein
MRTDVAPGLRSTAASHRLPALIGTLAVGMLVATLLAFQPHLRIQINTRRAIDCLTGQRCSRAVLLKTHTVHPEGPLGPATCEEQPHADVEWIQGPEGQAGGTHTCVGFNKVCVDQGAFVMHDERYNLVNGSDMPTFDLKYFKVCP